MRLVAALTLVAALAFAGRARAEERLVVGSKAFTESRVLGEIVAQLVEQKTGAAVERREGLGGTEIVFRALESGAIDLYPEYTGTAWAVLLGRSEPIRDPLRAWLEVTRGLEARGLGWRVPLGFANSYALAVSGAAARRLGLARISDLAGRRELRAGLSHEFLEREDGYKGLARAYGLDLGAVKGMEHGLAYEAVKSGAVDVIDCYTTDGKLLDYDLVVLEDDRRFFPPYDAALAVRGDLAARHPAAAAALEALAYRLSNDTMRELNHRAEQGGGRYAEVAREFLAREGLSYAPSYSVAREGLPAYLWRSRGRILARAGEHVLLTAIAVLLAIAVAIPLGVALTRRRKLATWVLAAAGVIQTVPSLALLAFLIPIPGLGLGARTAVTALFLYALLPLLVSSYAGVKSVDPELVDAARGMGLTERQILRHVELPLAMRNILAGVRTATVISIGVATLAAFVGAGGLGDPIITGLQLDDIRVILSGAIPAALLAVLADAGLARLEKRLVPRGLREDPQGGGQ